MNPVGSVTSAAQVLSAYRSTAARPAAEPSFSELVGNAAQSALDTVRQSEATTAAGVAGRADAQDVVQALGDAEITMQTVVAVRDKILGAYQQIMNMTV